MPQPVRPAWPAALGAWSEPIAARSARWPSGRLGIKHATIGRHSGSLRPTVSPGTPRKAGTRTAGPGGLVMLGWPARLQPTVDRRLAQPDGWCDLREGLAQATQADQCRVGFLALPAPRIASSFLGTGWLIGSGCDHAAVDAAGNLEGSLAHRLAVPLDGCLQGVAEMAEQMPTVRDLDRRGRTAPDPIGIRARPIAGDHLDPGVPAQPVGDGAGLAIRQQIDDAVALEIADDGAVTGATPPCPIIDPDHTGRRVCWRRRRARHAQQRAGADRQRQALGQAHAQVAAERHDDRLLDLAPPAGVSRSRGSDLRQSPGKDPLRARIVDAAQSTHAEAQLDLMALPRQIGQPALVTAVGPGR